MQFDFKRAQLSMLSMKEPVSDWTQMRLCVVWNLKVMYL